jgi:hypothetical protein
MIFPEVKFIKTRFQIIREEVIGLSALEANGSIILYAFRSLPAVKNLTDK